MRIVVLGALGQVGKRVVDEALGRGHQVTAVVRDPARLQEVSQRATARLGDAGSIEDVAEVSAGQDVVISVIRSPAGREGEVVPTTKRLFDGLARTGVRLLIVGGAASLLVPGTDGVRVIDDPRFLPSSARAVARGSFDQYELCLTENRVDWAYLSPPAELPAGRRTGRYRLGKDELLLDSEGRIDVM